MPIDFLTALRREVACVSHLARTLPRDAPIAHLPGWTVHDVLAHLAGDYRWAQQILTARERPATGLQSVMMTGEALTDEWNQVSEELIAQLATADPNSPCPNFARIDETAGWWVRHQAHETTLHRWDLESAAGTCTPIADELAADGIDELFPVYAERYSPFELPHPVSFGSPAGRRVWTVSPAGDGTRVRMEHTDTVAEPDIEASPSSLLLLLWNRLPLTDPSITVHRNGAAMQTFLDGPVTA